jgi:hypothetical protein
MPKKSVRSTRFKRPSHCSRKSMNSSLRSWPQRDPVFGSPLPGTGLRFAKADLLFEQGLQKLAETQEPKNPLMM